MALSATRVAVLVFVLACAALWALAVASMLGGNETAVNAVVGIPVGAALWLIAWALISRLGNLR